MLHIGVGARQQDRWYAAFASSSEERLVLPDHLPEHRHAVLLRVRDVVAYGDDRYLSSVLDHGEEHAYDRRINGLLSCDGVVVTDQLTQLATQIVDAERGQVVRLRRDEDVLAGDHGRTSDHVEVRRTVDDHEVIAVELGVVEGISEQPMDPKVATRGDAELGSADVCGEVEVHVDEAEVGRDEVQPPAASANHVVDSRWRDDELRQRSWRLVTHRRLEPVQQ